MSFAEYSGKRESGGKTPLKPHRSRTEAAKKPRGIGSELIQAKNLIYL